MSKNTKKKNAEKNKLSLTEFPYLEGNALTKKKPSNWPAGNSSVAFKPASDKLPPKSGEYS